ncbi:beta-propeller domain-containing protein [Pseudobacteriovorax antillogorgiicola]|uniref:Beta propeller domain-containing protein n=1 Tax=Pseudobacteriovorax antillogorgiicola TaxID=1513793 RepID=A0A1Y6CFB7_9BACT|nr:beta-propeller domain-containing protein [Pseudobacteriovorax antillogorgiicola]TCS49074.1 beta propeller domain-containing protein [Pseudobacteriovorax antillogorgiicola]SMF52119.1 Beta propeller domain-containing protein [Pseudobacteriovorax antillogorgiicola]
MKSTVSILIFLGLLSSCNIKDPFNSSIDRGDREPYSSGGGYSTFTLVTEFQSRIETYDSCESLQQDLEQRLDNVNRYYDEFVPWWETGETSSSGSQASQSSQVEEDVSEVSTNEDSITNVQEQGIDEADFVKRNAFHIYVLRQNKIEVIDRNSLAVIGQISVAGDDSNTDYYWRAMNAITNRSMFAHDQRLTVISQSQEDVIVEVFETTAGEVPTRILERRTQGSLIDSRYKNGFLFLATQDNVAVTIEYDPERSWWQHWELVSEQFADGTFRGVPCEQVLKSPANDWPGAITRLASIGVNQTVGAIPVQEVMATGALANDIYMGPSSIILHGYNSMTPYLYWARSRLMQTPITEISYDSNTGALSPKGRAILNGYIPKGQWSFKELSDGTISVATGTWGPLEVPEGSEINVSQNLEVGQNHLWLLKAEDGVHKILGSVINFGKPREDIRAVRYIDDKAYIVTFEKTDPLYTINLADRLAPRVEDALEIPGFSMYMHPIGEQYLVGVGFEAIDQGSFSLFQGIKVSLFDISTGKSVPTDRKVFGDRGSFSDVTGNHHAFFFNAEDQSFAVPMTTLGYADTNNSPREYGQELTFSGAIVFGIEAGLLVEKARISHDDLITSKCAANSRGRWWTQGGDSLDINRMFVHDNKVISVSRFGLKVHDPVSYDVSQVTFFTANDELCGGY